MFLLERKKSLHLPEVSFLETKNSYFPFRKKKQTMVSTSAEDSHLLWALWLISLLAKSSESSINPTYSETKSAVRQKKEITDCHSPLSTLLHCHQTAPAAISTAGQTFLQTTCRIFPLAWRFLASTSPESWVSFPSRQAVRSRNFRLVGFMLQFPFGHLYREAPFVLLLPLPLFIFGI